ncbi:MAG: MarR family transcriptional regulator [Eubacteriales bacterium]|nr:MarR family transcriptional regulator [Eubacteriales bacterium]
MTKKPIDSDASGICEGLLLKNQLCFPLYAASKEVVRLYKPFLDEIGLTYTQYIAMMALWESRALSVKELGERLYLDSGTLTPLLKKMEAQGLVLRKRSAADERSVIVTLTDQGEALKQRAKNIPANIGGCIPLSRDEANTLYDLLYRVLKAAR